ncbi:MAG TPA: PepSY-associated TM helix domain-containing protein [Bryobacteraceae bacterium]
MKRLYPVTRDLHLYLGLFISPLVMAFAVSVFFIVHAWIPGTGRPPTVRTASNLSVPAGVELLTGREQVDALRSVLDQAGVRGEVNFVRRIAKENRLVIPVVVPGREVSVDLNVEARSAVITERETGIASALVYLHKMPGQHNAALRGNSVYLRVWRWLADATVYLVLFLSVSGIYLWAVLRAERRIGLTLIAAGACSFFGLVYALAR